MRGNLWSRAPANRPARTGAPGRRRGPTEACRSVVRFRSGLGRGNAGTLAGRTGFTAGRRSPGREAKSCRGTVKLVGDVQVVESVGVPPVVVIAVRATAIGHRGRQAVQVMPQGPGLAPGAAGHR